MNKTTHNFCGKNENTPNFSSTNKNTPSFCGQMKTLQFQLSLFKTIVINNIILVFSR